MSWLRAEAYTRGKSIGEVVRDLVDGALRQNKNNESKNSITRQETGIK
jgi:hypothetical protein